MRKAASADDQALVRLIKAAATKFKVVDQRGIRSPIASTIGRVGALPTSIALGTLKNITRGMEPEKAERILSAYERYADKRRAREDKEREREGKKTRGELDDDILVSLGGSSPLRNLKRVWTRKGSWLPSRILGTAMSPLTDLVTSLMRMDHYNPWARSITSYTNHPSILGHELGHASDEENWGGGPSTYTFTRLPILREIQEGRASSRSTEILREALKDNPDLNVEGHNRLLGGGLGSYIGSYLPHMSLPASLVGQMVGATTKPFGNPRQGVRRPKEQEPQLVPKTAAYSLGMQKAAQQYGLSKKSVSVMDEYGEHDRFDPWDRRPDLKYEDPTVMADVIRKFMDVSKANKYKASLLHGAPDSDYEEADPGTVLAELERMAAAGERLSPDHPVVPNYYSVDYSDDMVRNLKKDPALGPDPAIAQVAAALDAANPKPLGMLSRLKQRVSRPDAGIQKAAYSLGMQKAAQLRKQARGSFDEYGEYWLFQPPNYPNYDDKDPAVMANMVRNFIDVVKRNKYQKAYLHGAPDSKYEAVNPSVVLKELERMAAAGEPLSYTSPAFPGYYSVTYPKELQRKLENTPDAEYPTGAMSQVRDLLGQQKAAEAPMTRRPGETLGQWDIRRSQQAQKGVKTPHWTELARIAKQQAAAKYKQLQAQQAKPVAKPVAAKPATPPVKPVKAVAPAKPVAPAAAQHAAKQKSIADMDFAAEMSKTGPSEMAKRRQAGAKKHEAGR
jgi:hypothetical protein